MGDDIPPDWAIERALALGFTGTKLQDVKRHWPGHTTHIAFARYIAEHEEPPVDPLADEAVAILANTIRDDDRELSHQQSHAIARRNLLGLRAVLTALKRGIEIGKSDA